jgi:pilus assembly protein Flp/PilA
VNIYNHTNVKGKAKDYTIVADENLTIKNFKEGFMMLEMVKLVLQNRKGQGMVEYGLILALVAIIAMAGLTPIGNNALATFTRVAGALTNP